VLPAKTRGILENLAAYSCLILDIDVSADKFYGFSRPYEVISLGGAPTGPKQQVQDVCSLSTSIAEEDARKSQ